jgi:hypothetical protein
MLYTDICVPSLFTFDAHEEFISTIKNSNPFPKFLKPCILLTCAKCNVE